MATRHLPSIIGRRLLASFAAILLLFAAALVVELYTLRRIADAEDQVARLDHAKHAGHMVAAQVRDQYIHQAHTLIERGTGHLDHYAAVAAATKASIDHLRALAGTAAEQVLVADIARLAAENDRDFTAVVIPAIEGGGAGNLQPQGAQLEAVVDQVVTITDQLNASFEARSDGARVRARHLRDQALIATITCFALAIMLAAAVGMVLTRSLVRRVEALRAGARRVGAGDLRARITLEGRDEFTELADVFNHMTASLAREQAALVRSQKLASIGQVAAGVAHELNNPLAVILGYAKVLRRSAGATDIVAELQIVEDEARQCQRIVQGLLDLARPQQLDVTAVDLTELAREAVDRLRDADALAGHDVRVAGAGSVVAMADAGKLRQVIANLVVNATEAAPTAGRVDVDARADGDDVILTVTDDGPGIAEDVRSHMFDPFFTTKRGGTGLGLAIAHAIVDAHGGHISVASASGTGTSVSLRLPRSMPGDEVRS